jgi:hypothetical protein
MTRAERPRFFRELRHYRSPSVRLVRLWKLALADEDPLAFKMYPRLMSATTMTAGGLRLRAGSLTLS